MLFNNYIINKFWITSASVTQFFTIIIIIIPMKTIIIITFLIIITLSLLDYIMVRLIFALNLSVDGISWCYHSIQMKPLWQNFGIVYMIFSISKFNYFVIFFLAALQGEKINLRILLQREHVLPHVLRACLYLVFPRTSGNRMGCVKKNQCVIMLDNPMERGTEKQNNSFWQFFLTLEYYQQRIQGEGGGVVGHPDPELRGEPSLKIFFFSAGAWAPPQDLPLIIQHFICKILYMTCTRKI